MADSRLAQVPDGLAGERIDAALARMFGLSRSRAAALAEAGEVELDGRRVGKSARVEAGQLLEVRIPDAAPPGSVAEADLPELVVLYDDADIVVVDKPVGVVAHPSLGFDGPSVTGVLKALPGVDDAQVSLEQGSATVRFDPTRVSVEALRAAVEDAGFDAPA